MSYLIDIFLLLTLVALAAGASYYRLRKKDLYFWGIFGLAVIYRVCVSFARGRDFVGVVMDLVSLGVLFFLVDLFMARDKKK